MKPRLTRNFFKRDTVVVARDLIGQYLVRQYQGKKIIGRIVETEAYHGFNDRASHASRGRTLRNAVMFSGPGFAYVYLVYGINYCLNIVTGPKDFPAAVLIRAVEPIKGLEVMRKLRQTESDLNLTNGPGKLCQAFQLNLSHNGQDVIASKELWLARSAKKIKPAQIVAGRRIGVDYAGAWKNKKWRFGLKGSKFLSKKF